MSALSFAENRIYINEIPESSMIRKQFYSGQEEENKLMVQFTIGSNALIINLTELKPYCIDTLMQIDQFKNPLFFASSGYVYITKYQTFENNTDQTLGFKRPFISNQTKGLYRPFAEIDLFQMIKLGNLVIDSPSTREITKTQVGEIEPFTTVSVYD